MRKKNETRNKREKQWNSQELSVVTTKAVSLWQQQIFLKLHFTKQNDWEKLTWKYNYYSCCVMNWPNYNINY